MRLFAARLLCSLVLFLFAAYLAGQSNAMPYDSVDPLIGTAGGGNTFPGATLPFGMIQWSPDTNTDGWYKYDEKKLYGFSLTHISGAGCPLYGDFAVLPVLDELTWSTAEASVPVEFDRKGEKAQPGYYAVTLKNGVKVELTVTERAGIARFTFPQGAAMRMLINAGSSANSIASPNDDPKIREGFGNHIEIKTDGSFAGWTSAGRFCGSDSHYKLYVAGKFDKPIKSMMLWGDESRLKAPEGATGKHTGAWVNFGSTPDLDGMTTNGKNPMVTLRIGISFVSEARALANLQKEIRRGTSTRCTKARRVVGSHC
jgi:putative alpha-1,2-mannosidase